MITKIDVNGFRSLEDFVMDLAPGLNILVGPNGSGKTNIVMFFEFLSHIAKSGLSEAITRIGGAGALFTRVNRTENKDNIDAVVYGCVKEGKQSKNKFIFYRYEFEIKWLKDIETVVFSRQKVSCKCVDKYVQSLNVCNELADWSIVFGQTYDFVKHKNKFSVDASDAKLLSKFGYPFSPKRSKENIEAFFEKMLTENSSILNILGFSEGLGPIITDFIGGESYNIIPTQVKLPEDSTREPVIGKDGAGLAATLYAMEKKTYSRPFERFPFLLYPYQRGLIGGGLKNINKEKILQYVQLANSSIANFTVKNDAYNNQLQVRVDVKGNNNIISLPLTAMSDGTIKWITLITAILSSSSVFSIEEPENYLHPTMQSQLLNIIREISRKKEYHFTLMTTHSETILNSSNPMEIVVISFSDGTTHATRCSNVKQLKDEIKRTGFGLGYYYLAGALQND